MMTTSITFLPTRHECPLCGSLSEHPPEPLTLQQAAAVLGHSYRHIRRLAAAGKLELIISSYDRRGIPRGLKVTAESVLALLAEKQARKQRRSRTFPPRKTTDAETEQS
jgi:hypothetical protein